MGRRSPSYIRLRERDHHHHPGCVHGLLRFLNYHNHWHNVKRILPSKKHAVRPEAASPGVGYADSLGSKQAVRAPEFERKDTSSVLFAPVVPAGTKNSTSKRSIRARIKALISEKDKSKSKSTAPGHSEQPNLIGSSKVKLREKVDVFEIFKVDKQILLEILHDQDIATAIKSLDKESLNRRSIRLVKSGSFPAPSSSHLRATTPSRLENKHKEVWPQAKGMDILNFEATLSEDAPASNFLPAGDDNNINGSVLDKGKGQAMRRASSLNESASRYAQFFDFVFKNDTRKNLLSSRSLKLGCEGESISSEPTQRAFRRRLSGTETDYRSLLPITETVREAAADERKSDVEQSADLITLNMMKAKGLENVIVSSAVVNFPMNSESGKEKEEKTSSGKKREDNRDNIAAAGSFKACQSPDSVLDTFSRDDEKAKSDSLVSEGPDSQSTSNSTLEMAENLETPKDDKLLHLEVEERFKTDFHYVKHVLDVLGLITTKDLPLDQLAWHSFDQPLRPSLYDEVEVHYSSSLHDELKCSSIKNAVETANSRKLLFDLINKALVNIDEKTCLYYPKALSASCHVHPMAKSRYGILDEVWAYAVRCLKWEMEINSSLDDLVAKDLYANDGWMNLQTESEYISLEMDDLILEELLDDIIISCF